MKKFIEFCKDYWSYFNQPDTLDGLLMAVYVAAATILMAILG